MIGASADSMPHPAGGIEHDGFPKTGLLQADQQNPSFPDLDKAVSNYRFKLRILESGRVLALGDGIAWISGLPSASMEELLIFEEGSRGLVFHLGMDRLGAILLEQTDQLTSGVLRPELSETSPAH